MANPYISYYSNQVGSGISGFSGIKYQRGAGFFGRLFQSAILPALKYLGKTALSTGSQVLSDVAEGHNIKESLRSRGLSAGKRVASDALARGQRYIQTGKGRRRRRRTTTKATKRLRKRPIHTPTILVRRVKRRRVKRKTKINKKGRCLVRASFLK